VTTHNARKPERPHSFLSTTSLAAPQADRRRRDPASAEPARASHVPLRRSHSRERTCSLPFRSLPAILELPQGPGNPRLETAVVRPRQEERWRAPGLQPGRTERRSFFCALSIKTRLDAFDSAKTPHFIMYISAHFTMYIYVIIISIHTEVEAVKAGIPAKHYRSSKKQGSIFD